MKPNVTFSGTNINWQNGKGQLWTNSCSSNYNYDSNIIVQYEINCFLFYSSNQINYFFDSDNSFILWKMIVILLVFCLVLLLIRKGSVNYNEKSSSYDENFYETDDFSISINLEK